jgi:PST family polysaccharide transporter
MKNADSQNTVLGSIRWSIVGQLLSRVMMVAVSIVLARLLEPTDFGLMAMAMVVIGFMETFYELGIGSAIIQKKEVNHELLSSLFYINMIFGVLLAIFFGASAEYVAQLYQDIRVTPILRTMSVVFIISSLGLINHALMRRNLRFDKLIIIETIALLIDGTVAIVLAVMGFGVWALVYSLLANRLAMTLFLFYTERWFPGMHFSWTEVKTIWGFALNLTGSKVFNYFSRNSDKFIIGRFLGPASLGYYSLAFKLISYPIEFIQAALGRVLFPALARLDDNESLQQLYLRACGAIALLSFPILVGMGILADPFIRVVYDEKWAPAIMLLVILTPVGLVQSLLSTVIHLYLVKGRTDQYFVWAFTSGLVIALSFICGLPWGLLGVTVSFSIAVMILGTLGFWAPFKLIELKMSKFLHTLWPYIWMSTVMGISIWICLQLMEWGGLGKTPELLIGTLVGFIVYAALCIVTKPAALIDLIRLMPKTVQKNRIIRRLTGFSESDTKVDEATTAVQPNAPVDG